jgi:hypothetical protein
MILALTFTSARGRRFPAPRHELVDACLGPPVDETGLGRATRHRVSHDFDERCAYPGEFRHFPLPEEAMEVIRTQITTNIRFNSIVTTGVPGFIHRA